MTGNCLSPDIIPMLLTFIVDILHNMQVLLEALRLYPPATGIFKGTKPGGMMLGEYYIPRATQVTVSYNTLHIYNVILL